MKDVTISVSGVPQNAEIERACRGAVAPFVGERNVPVSVVFDQSGDIGIKIETTGITLLRHPRMIEPALLEEVRRIQTRRAVPAMGGASTQFTYVPGQSEAAADVVLEK